MANATPNFLNLMTDIISKVGQLWNSLWNVFNGVDFQSLWFWLPQDIQASIQIVLSVLFVVALIQLIKKLIFIFN